MSNSPLVVYTKITHKSNPRQNSTYNPSGKITKITIHHMSGNATIEGVGEWFAGASSGSSNYGVGTDGRIAMYVEENRRAWTSSNKANDYQAVTIEVANNTGAPEWKVSDKALESTIALCVDICRRNGIARLNYTGDKTGNLTMHKWFASTDCPGPYLESKFPYIAQEVNRRLNGETEQQPESKPVEKPEKVATYALTLPLLRKGDKGDPVKAMQNLLLANKIKLPRYGADGDFGGETEAGVIAFQKAVGIEADGVVGRDTMSKLLKL